MPSRRIACLLLGFWLGGAVMAAWLPLANADSPRRLLASSSAQASSEIQAAGPRAALLLRYQAAEQTRWLLRRWGLVQIALGGGLFLFLLFASREGKRPLALAFLMPCFAALQRFFLVPGMTDLGRALDFAPPHSMAGESARLSVVAIAYWACEIVKWTAGAWLIGLLAFSRRRPSGYAVNQFDMVDKPDHRHIDR